MIKKFLASRWMVVPVGALTYLVALAAFWRTPVVNARRVLHPVDHTEKVGPSWEFSNPEADELITELQVEKKALAERERQLNELALRLEAEKAELHQVTQTVQLMQADFDKATLRVQTEETANLKRLAKVYSTMAPESAAGILGELDDDAIVKIMLFMKESDTAGILEAFAKRGSKESKRAASISERLRLSFRNPTTP